MSKTPIFSALLAASTLCGCAPSGIAAPKAKTAPLKSASPIAAQPASKAPRAMQSSAPIETSFRLPAFSGDPFDFEKNDVRVQIRQAGGGTISIPAFFDGGTTWRARHTPTSTGQYSVAAITLNGRKIAAQTQPRAWRVSGASNTRLPGFVRLKSNDKSRFAFSNGAPYYPLGHNQAWQTGGLPDIPELFDKMGAAGENWSRVWMNHWDNKNLDWPKSGEFGTLNLDVARRWDGIVTAAERNGIALQMVFQHHGQYSTQVNPNWDENPYSAKNGGFLATPNEFFTNQQAKNLTKRKLRYSVARWGYSPSILAWELFNEVQFTDAARAKEWDAVSSWHREMAAFLRAQDAYRHLITTSSAESIPAAVWDAMDFYQGHTYPADVITALNSASQPEESPRKPFFIGEFGPSGVQDPTGTSLHAGIWAGLMSEQAGAPQFWTWDDVERHNLYFHFRAATGFVKASRLPQRNGLKKVIPVVTTTSMGALSFGPGGGWEPVKQNEFTVDSSGPPAGIGSLSRYLQGEANRTLGPKPLVFRVNYPRAGQFIVEIGEVTGAGAHLVLDVDGQRIERDFPGAGERIKPQGEAGRVAIDVPAGAHTVTLQNTGGDWASIARLTLTNYAPVLGAYGLSGSDFAAAWVYHRENVAAAPSGESGAASGQIALPGLEPGRYHATWWDTRRGEAISAQAVTVGATPLQLQTPAVLRDAALFVEREAP